MQAYHSIKNIVEELKSDYKKLTDYEALTLAVQIQRSQILVSGLNISKSDSHPSALEAIAIQLGYKKNGISTITSGLADINESLSK